MVLTMLCLTLVVFFMVNLEPNLRKLSISQLDMRSSDEHIESWLVKNGYRDNFFVRYGRWLGWSRSSPASIPRLARRCRVSPTATSLRALLRRHPAG